MNTTQRDLLRVLHISNGQSIHDAALGVSVGYSEAEREIYSLAERGLVVMSSRHSGWILTPAGLDYRHGRMGDGGDHFNDIPGGGWHSSSAP